MADRREGCHQGRGPLRPSALNFSTATLQDGLPGKTVAGARPSLARLTD